MNKMSLSALLTLIVILSGCQSQSSIESRNMTTFHRYWKDIVNRGDFAKHHEIISPDFAIYVAGEDTGELRGIDIFKEMAQQNDQSFSKIDIIEDDSVINKNRLATQWHGYAIHDRGPAYGFEVIPGDKELVWYGTAFYKFDDNGLITEARLLTNMNEVLRKRAEQATEQSDPN